MPSIVIRPKALADLAGIWAYIAEDSVRHADAFASRLNEQFRLLARQPSMGRARPELLPNLRSYPVGPIRDLLHSALGPRTRTRN